MEMALNKEEYIQGPRKIYFEKITEISVSNIFRVHTINVCCSDNKTFAYGSFLVNIHQKIKLNFCFSGPARKRNQVLTCFETTVCLVETMFYFRLATIKNKKKFSSLKMLVGY